MAIGEIDVTELHALGEAVRLVDVREPDEWDDGHISFARHVPLGSVPERMDAFDGSPTYVICKAGGRSMRACELLAGEGIAVVNVTGGMMAWQEAGFDVVKGDGPGE